MSKRYSIGDLALTLTRALPQELTLTQAHARAIKSWFFFYNFSEKTPIFFSRTLFCNKIFLKFVKTKKVRARVRKCVCTVRTVYVQCAYCAYTYNTHVSCVPGTIMLSPKGSHISYS